ncbi:oligosaccharide flippase family protein, partial [Clostridium baratii]
QNTFSLINRFACLVIRMEQKGKIYSLLQVLTKLFYIAFVLLFFKIFNRDYRTLAVAITLATIITSIIAIAIEKKQWFSKNNNNNNKLKTSTKELFLFGMPLILSTAISWIFQSTDRFFISAYSGYAELGIYSSAFSIVALLNAIQGTFTTFWIPVANEKYQENPNDTKFFEDINSIISIVMLLIAACLITSKDLIVLLLGPKYRDAAFIFPFLVFMPIMYTISETTVLGINFKKKTKYHIHIAIISAVTNLIGNSLLVPFMGARGAAISTGLSYVIFFIARTIISKKLYYVNYNLKRFLICTIFIVILSIYASLYSFDWIMLLLGILTLIVIFIAYKITIYKLISKCKFKIKNY